MKNKINKKIICLAAAALVLVAGISAKSVMAYFTTYVLAEGQETLSLEFPATSISETAGENGEKVLVVQNVANQNEETVDCYVRVRVIAPSHYGIRITDAEPNDASGNAVDNWSANTGGFYEYNSVLEAGASTTPLHIQIDKTANPAAEDANVIVIQECAPVLYDATGNPYVDWDGSDFVIEKK